VPEAEVYVKKRLNFVKSQSFSVPVLLIVKFTTLEPEAALSELISIFVRKIESSTSEMSVDAFVIKIV
jgi:hypothetical protein